MNETLKVSEDLPSEQELKERERELVAEDYFIQAQENRGKRIQKRLYGRPMRAMDLDV